MPRTAPKTAHLAPSGGVGFPEFPEFLPPGLRHAQAAACHLKTPLASTEWGDSVESYTYLIQGEYSDGVKKVEEWGLREGQWEEIEGGDGPQVALVNGAFNDLDWFVSHHNRDLFYKHTRAQDMSGQWAPLYKHFSRDASAARVAAKFQKKKEVPKADGSGTTTVYEYSEKQVQHRHREKAKKIEGLRKSIGKLRTKARKDMASDDPKTAHAALAVVLMDETYERVGNAESAKEGHYGVTGWQIEHVSFSGGSATIRYTGKSGVDHEKKVTNAQVVKALRAAAKGKKKGECVLDVEASDVNAYLKPHGVSAKDIRGLHANEEVKSRLKAERSKGGKLPTDKKERETKLKAEFKKALEGAAEAVGHEAATLRSQYLVPGMEDNYLKDGTVQESLDKTGSTHDHLARGMVRGPPGGSRVLELPLRKMLPLRQWGNPIEADRCGDVDGHRVCGDDFEFYEALVESIRRKGVQKPIELAWFGSKPELVDGHHRLNAAWEAGLRTVPVRVSSTITDETLVELGLLSKGKAKKGADSRLIRELAPALAGDEEPQETAELLLDALYAGAERALDDMLRKLEGPRSSRKFRVVRTDSKDDSYKYGDDGESVSYEFKFPSKVTWSVNAKLDPRGVAVEAAKEATRWSRITTRDLAALALPYFSRVLAQVIQSRKRHHNPYELDGTDLMEAAEEFAYQNVDSSPDWEDESFASAPVNAKLKLDVDADHALTAKGTEFHVLYTFTYKGDILWPSHHSYDRYMAAGAGMVARRFLGTKDDREIEDEQIEHNLRRDPKKKPPRNDLRKRLVEEKDRDEPTETEKRKDKYAAARVASEWFIEETWREFLGARRKKRKPRNRKQTPDPEPAEPEAPESSFEDRVQESAEKAFERNKKLHPKSDLGLDHFVEVARKKLQKEDGGAEEDAPTEDPANNEPEGSPEDAELDSETTDMEQKRRDSAIKKHVEEAAKAMGVIQHDNSIPQRFKDSLSHYLSGLAEWQQKEFAASLGATLERLKTSPPDESAALEFARKARSSEMPADHKEAGVVLADKLYAENVVFNPANIGSTAASNETEPMSDEGMAAHEEARRTRSEQAFKFAQDLSDEEKQDLADQVSDEMSKVDPKSKRGRELMATYYGIALSSAAKGEEPPKLNDPELQIPNSPSFIRLAQALSHTGREVMLLGAAEDLTSPTGRQTIRDSLEALDTEQLSEFVLENSPLSIILDRLMVDDAEDDPKEKLPAKVRAEFRKMILDSITDNATLLDPLIGEYRAANGEKESASLTDRITDQFEEGLSDTLSELSQDDDGPSLREETTAEQLLEKEKNTRIERVKHIWKRIQNHFSKAPDSKRAKELMARLQAVVAEGSTDVLEQRIVERTGSQNLPGYSFVPWTDSM